MRWCHYCLYFCRLGIDTQKHCNTHYSHIANEWQSQNLNPRFLFYSKVFPLHHVKLLYCRGDSQIKNIPATQCDNMLLEGVRGTGEQVEGGFSLKEGFNEKQTIEIGLPGDQGEGQCWRDECSHGYTLWPYASGHKWLTQKRAHAFVFFPGHVISTSLPKTDWQRW